MGLYLGIGGVVTFKNSRKLKEVAEYAPLNQILLETDCPYMAPVPCRGRRCHSGMIAHTAAFIAARKGIPEQTLLETAAQNARRLFGL